MRNKQSLLTFAVIVLAAGALPALRAQNNGGPNRRNFQSPNGGITIFGGSTAPEPVAPTPQTPVVPPPVTTPTAPSALTGPAPVAPVTPAPAPATMVADPAAPVAPATPTPPPAPNDRRNYHPVNGGILLFLPSSFTSAGTKPQPPPPPDKRRDYHSPDGGIPLDTSLIGPGRNGTDLPSDRRAFH